MGYRESKQQVEQRFDDMLKPTYKGRLYRPRWDDKVRVETHIRPTGPLLPDMTGFASYRIDSASDGFGDWIATYPIFLGGTTSFCSFVSSLEDPDHRGECLSPKIQKSPVHVFLDNVYKMSKEDTVIEVKFYKGAEGKGAACPKRPKRRTLIQGVMLKNGAGPKYDYYGDPRFPAVLELSESAETALMAQLNQIIPGYAGPTDALDQFVSGDIVDADVGQILSFFNGSVGAEQKGGPVKVDWSNRQKAGATKGSERMFSSYSCELIGSLAMPRNEDGTLQNAKEGLLWTPWKDVVQFLDERQMVNKLCEAFSDYPDVLRVALSDYSSMLTKSAKGNANVTVQGNKPATTPAATTAASPAASTRKAGPAVAWGNAKVGKPAEPEAEETDGGGETTTAAGGDSDGDKIPFNFVDGVQDPVEPTDDANEPTEPAEEPQEAAPAMTHEQMQTAMTPQAPQQPVTPGPNAKANEALARLNAARTKLPKASAAAKKA